jgi:hypothetical protein
MPGRQRSILASIEVRPAGRLCRCGHDQRHAIRKGELRFIVKNPGPASGEKGYCAKCAVEMLNRAHARIDELRGRLA